MILAEPQAATHRAGSRRGGGLSVAALAAWAALVVVANRWGEALANRGVETRVHAPPIFGSFEGSLSPALVPVVALAVVAIAAGPGFAVRVRWRRLLLASFFAAAAWASAVALSAGWSALHEPMSLPGQYLLDVPNVGSPRQFLRNFTEEIDGYGIHVRSHPPGFVLLLWVLDRLGLGGSGPAAALAIGGGASAVPAVLVAVREVAGEQLARRSAPFVALAPAAFTVATTADAFFAGVAAWACTSVVLASGRRGRSAVALGLAGGVLGGTALMLSYGLVLIGLVPAVVCLSRRRLAPLGWASVGAAVVLGAFWIAGFSWYEGLEATRIEYSQSVAQFRPYGYFLVANLAAFALMLGPAPFASLLRLRERGIWLLAGSALVAIAVADLSGLSKGEVERIWLPFAFWVLPACAALWPAARASDASRSREVRGWLGAQAAVTLALQVGIRTHW